MLHQKIMVDRRVLTHVGHGCSFSFLPYEAAAQVGMPYFIINIFIPHNKSKRKTVFYYINNLCQPKDIQDSLVFVPYFPVL